MRLVVRDRDGQLLGTAYLDEDGRAVLTGAMRTWEGRHLINENLRPVFQDEGRDFIWLLVKEFRTPYVKIEFQFTEEERRRARRFVWLPGDLRWVTPPHPTCPRCGSGFTLRVFYGREVPRILSFARHPHRCPAPGITCTRCRFRGAAR